MGTTKPPKRNEFTIFVVLGNFFWKTQCVENELVLNSNKDEFQHQKKSWRKCVLLSSPRCTREPVAVCQVVCRTCPVPPVVTLLVLPLEDQLLKRSINVSVFSRATYYTKTSLFYCHSYSK